MCSCRGEGAGGEHADCQWKESQLVCDYRQDWRGQCTTIGGWGRRLVYD